MDCGKRLDVHRRSTGEWFDGVQAYEGKVYCAVMLDTFSRRVVGWSIDSSQTSALVTNALGMAIANRYPQSGGIIHSDHGVQFTSWAFTDRAKRSRVGPVNRVRSVIATTMR